jgi:PHP family Zn ribbon phosphoesterase
MVLKIKPHCPKCGSNHISNVTSRLPLVGGGLSKINKHYPENDPPKYKYVRPAQDFNFNYYCNSCGHYFGKE